MDVLTVKSLGWICAILLFDLLQDDLEEHNSLKGTSLESPASDLIAWVLVLLEWYCLYR